jgi:hypothetical protein
MPVMPMSLSPTIKASKVSQMEMWIFDPMILGSVAEFVGDLT